MGPQSDAAGASHRDVASQKAMEGLFQHLNNVSRRRLSAHTPPPS